MARINHRHSTFVLDAPLLSEDDASLYSDFLRNALSSEHSNVLGLLSSLPYRSPASYGPLVVLSAILSAHPGRWPVLELQQAYCRAWKTIPEDAKSGNASPQGQQLLDRSLRQCKQAYNSLVDLFHSNSNGAAIIEPESGRSWDHKTLVMFIRNFSLPISTALSQPKPVVAISLPNGPLLAMSVSAIATYYTAAPVAHGSGVGAEQFKADVLQSKSNIVIASKRISHDSAFRISGSRKRESRYF